MKTDAIIKQAEKRKRSFAFTFYEISHIEFDGVKT